MIPKKPGSGRRKKHKTESQLRHEVDILRTRLAEQGLSHMLAKWSSSRMRVERRHLDKILSRLPYGVSVISTESKIQYMNMWLIEKFGDHIGDTCYKVFRKADKPCADCLVKASIRTNSVCTRDIHKDADRYYQTLASPIGDYDGTKSGLEITIEVTDKQLAQQKIAQQANFIQRAMDSLDYPFYVVDLDYKVVLANKAARDKGIFEGVTCYGATHDRKKPCDDLTHGCPLHDVVLTRRPVQLEHVHRDQHGNERVYEIHGDPVFDSEGNVVQMIETTIDITDHKRSEKAIKELNKQLKHLVIRDPHTGLYNYRHLVEVCESEFDRAGRHGYPLSAVMFDLDYFKAVNDVYGHKFGDLVLKQLAERLKRIVRSYDTLVRYGGEEFVIICPRADRYQAMKFARRLLETINTGDFGNEENKIRLKASVAVASYPENFAASAMELVDMADTMLKKVKQDGGNKVYSSEEVAEDNICALETTKERQEICLLKDKISKLTNRVNSSLIEELYAFAMVRGLNDGYTKAMIYKSRDYAERIASEMGLSDSKIAAVKRAYALHDLGKIGISERILTKATPLTDKEFEQVKKSPTIAVNIIGSVQFLHDTIPLILYHRERWDAQGYPSGLKKERIPIGARIIGVVDAYRALVSDRPYRKAYAKERAMEILEEGAGTQFDPNVVKVFLNILGEE